MNRMTDGMEMMMDGATLVTDGCTMRQTAHVQRHKVQIVQGCLQGQDGVHHGR